METILSRAIESALAHPHALLVAAFAALAGLTWIASRLLTKRAAAEMVARQIAEADRARRSS